MSDRNIKIDVSVKEMRIIHEALTTYWRNHVAAAAEGPTAGRNLFNCLVRNDNKEAIENLGFRLDSLAKEHTEKARLADLVRMRLEPIMEEHEETSNINTTRQATADWSTGCGGGGGL